MLQKLLSRMRKAITDYNMISDGDKIAIGVSGGKDSLVLLYCMKELQRFLAQKFDLVAETMSLGNEVFEFVIKSVGEPYDKNKIQGI